MRSLSPCSGRGNNVLIAWFGAVLLCGLTMTGARADIIESINSNSDSNSSNAVYYSFDRIGWYYTPGVSYELTGIDGYFDPLNGDPKLTIDPNATQTVTIELYDERPAVGVNPIASTTFVASPYNGGWQGGDFSGIDLVAGTQYLIAFSGLTNMGLNVVSWNYDLGASLPDGVESLAAYYRGDNYENELTDITRNIPGPNSTTLAYVSPVSPILRFEGNLSGVSPVPEPSTLALAGCGICAWLGIGARRRMWAKIS